MLIRDGSEETQAHRAEADPAERASRGAEPRGPQRAAGALQGGLTTCMELTATGRPFLYFPLKHHFEQNFHVHHRLRRHRAGRRMDFDTSSPDAIAEAIVEETGQPVDYLDVESDGAARAAALIADLL